MGKHVEEMLNDGHSYDIEDLVDNEEDNGTRGMSDKVMQYTEVAAMHSPWDSHPQTPHKLL